MATVNLSSYLVFPTENDVNGGTVGAGRVGSEYRRARLQHALSHQHNYVLTGFTLPTSGALANSVAAGECVIDGYLIKGTSAISVTFPASTTHFVFVQLLYSSGIVTSAQLITQSSATPPGNSVMLGTVTTNGSAVTGSTDRRPQGLVMFGKVSNSNTIDDYGTGGWTVSSSTVTLPSGFFRAPRVIATPVSAVMFGVNVTSATQFSVNALDDVAAPASHGGYSWIAYL